MTAAVYAWAVVAAMLIGASVEHTVRMRRIARDSGPVWPMFAASLLWPLLPVVLVGWGVAIRLRRRRRRALVARIKAAAAKMRPHGDAKEHPAVLPTPRPPAATRNVVD